MDKDPPPPTIETVYAAIQFAAETSTLLSNLGVAIEVGSDFDYYAEEVAEARPDQPIGPPFDHHSHYFTDQNAFWVMGRDRHDKIVHCQAMRLVDLAGGSLAGYMTRRFRDYSPVGLTLDLSRSRYRPGPAARRIAGRVCYHGDLWLSRSIRGTGVTALLSRFALVTALLHLRPSYIFGFMGEGLAFRGLTEREGYMHAEPATLTWQLSTSEDALEGFMVSVSREDLAQLLLVPPERLLTVRK